jgi:peptide-methionine (S)-S-oxide reductase
MKRLLACLACLCAIDAPAAPLAVPAEQEEAIFAGGCFWCMEEAMEKVHGTIAVISGYTGGRVKNPTYEQVSSGGTGHVEAVRVTFDSATLTYAQLVDAFWRNIDPTDRSGQFCDRGEQYRSAIFVKDAAQRAVAEQSKRSLETSGKLPQPIATTIEAAGPFYAAEGYHQDYYKKNPIQYRFYKLTCGRARRLEVIWGPPQVLQR